MARQNVVSTLPPEGQVPVVDWRHWQSEYEKLVNAIAKAHDLTLQPFSTEPPPPQSASGWAGPSDDSLPPIQSGRTGIRSQPTMLPDLSDLDDDGLLYGEALAYASFLDDEDWNPELAYAAQQAIANEPDLLAAVLGVSPSSSVALTTLFGMASDQLGEDMARKLLAQSGVQHAAVTSLGAGMTREAFSSWAIGRYQVPDFSTLQFGCTGLSQEVCRQQLTDFLTSVWREGGTAGRRAVEGFMLGASGTDRFGQPWGRVEVSEGNLQAGELLWPPGHRYLRVSPGFLAAPVNEIAIMQFIHEMEHFWWDRGYAGTTYGEVRAYLTGYNYFQEGAGWTNAEIRKYLTPGDATYLIGTYFYELGKEVMTQGFMDTMRGPLGGRWDFAEMNLPSGETPKKVESLLLGIARGEYP